MAWVKWCAVLLMLFSLQLSVLPPEQAAETIILVEDVDSLTIHSGEKVILNLNHHCISDDTSADAVWIQPGAELILEGEGSVVNSGGGSLIFNEGSCSLSGDILFLHDSGGYAVINHGYMEIGGDVCISSLKSSSSLIENGYYECTSGNYRTGYVEGWEHPELNIHNGEFSGGRISVKNDDWGICRIYGGLFHNAKEAALKNWGSMDVYGGEFIGGNNNIVVGMIRERQDWGDLRIHGGYFTAGKSRALFAIGADTDTDYGGYLHGEVSLLGGEYTGFHYWYNTWVSTNAVLNVSEDVELEIWGRVGN